MESGASWSNVGLPTRLNVWSLISYSLLLLEYIVHLATSCTRHQAGSCGPRRPAPPRLRIKRLTAGTSLPPRPQLRTAPRMIRCTMPETACVPHLLVPSHHHGPARDRHDTGVARALPLGRRGESPAEPGGVQAPRQACAGGGWARRSGVRVWHTGGSPTTTE